MGKTYMIKDGFPEKEQEKVDNILNELRKIGNVTIKKSEVLRIALLTCLTDDKCLSAIRKAIKAEAQ